MVPMTTAAETCHCLGIVDMPMDAVRPQTGPSRLLLLVVIFRLVDDGQQFQHLRLQESHFILQDWSVGREV